MITRSFARTVLACGVSLGAFVAPAMAQTAPDITSPNSASESSESGGTIVVTGSRIKRDPTKSALPLEIITSVDIERNGIANPEALNMFLTSNGSGADNLASNADVVTGAQRGTNGLSAANLRGQGSAATLILLNGRRVAAHGLSGGAVDVNQIPFAAIERVEILKDGASAIYGTDAIGGVINYITKKNFKGLSLSGSTDVTEQGGGNIYRLSAAGGWGDLDEDGINIMGTVSYGWNEMLRGSQRDFVNGNQSSRGLSVDTRGTPIASVFPAAITPLNAALFPNGVLFGGSAATYRVGTTNVANPYYIPNFYFPGTTTVANGGVNILDLPGGAGCETMDGGMAYDTSIWTTTAGAAWACAWDTGRAAVIQQPIETLTYYTKATVNLGGGHQLSAEVTGSDANSAKSFSHAQLSTNGTNFPAVYPLLPSTQTQYDAVYNAIYAAFAGSPGAQSGLAANYGDGIAFRWRCIACGPREYKTHTKTLRALVALEGPLPFEGWDYRVAASHSESESSSVLGSGYYYRGTLNNGNPDPLAPTAPGASAPGLVGMLNSGILNPFSVEQSAAAMAGLEAISAYGTTLYGGRYTVKEVDASISGPLFELPGGSVQMALGVDWRRETYAFNGSPAAAANQPVIMLAAFDNVNALIPKNRTVKAGFVEINIPLLDILEISGAVRLDDYTGFGKTTNPKVTVKFAPTQWVMFRGSYSTGFRVPSFNQI
ncbi:MAG TPA: TonB-dependent receptor, partial [Novosphingobium sp.]|nr:TonB-dependent receptor [Novosphingobium sp.]